jgi:hypothetical protein
VKTETLERNLNNIVASKLMILVKKAFTSFDGGDATTAGKQITAAGACLAELRARYPGD